MRARRTTAFALVCLHWTLVLVGLWSLDAGTGAAHVAEARNPDGVAVIIGNKDYADVGDVAYAHRDAGAFHRYVIDVLGFNLRNVRLVADADCGKMRSLSGTEGRCGILGRFVGKRRELSDGLCCPRCRHSPPRGCRA